jgi:hypothetical protein
MRLQFIVNKYSVGKQDIGLLISLYVRLLFLFIFFIKVVLIFRMNKFKILENLIPGVNLYIGVKFHVRFFPLIFLAQRIC